MISISLYSEKDNEIKLFLEKYYDNTIEINNTLTWEKNFENPIEMVNLIGVFIDNNDKYKINMWISIDEGVFLNVTDYNSNKIIKYLFERFPY